ncbi:hypothetical protein E2320_003064 [Naja naja]|nr:hypothetical protein E2320_003064 [Naja naja]
MLGRLTLQIVPGNEFETFIQKDDRQGYLEHHEPMMQVQVCQFEDHLENTRTTMETSIEKYNSVEFSKKWECSLLAIWVMPCLRFEGKKVH